MRPDSLRDVSPREETRRNQAAAADPTASVWVSANAGTGKTYVLTLRMLRLLLAGTKPARILALTYTKAAAAEMATRVAGRLADWVTADDATLVKVLGEVLDRPPTPEEMTRARQLFALVIETPGGLKVQTIHAFCERLLQRFPLEAGVPPSFEILDDPTRDALLAEAADQVLTEAAKAPAGSPLGDALKRTIAYTAESSFDDLLADALRHRDWLNKQVTPALHVLADALRYREWLEQAERLDVAADGLHLDEAADLYRRALGLPPGATLERTDQAVAGVLTEAQLRRVRGILAEGSKTDQKASAQIDAVLAAAEPAARLAALARVFLKSDGEPRTSFMTKGLAAGYPEVEALLQDAQRRFVPLHEQRCKLELMEATLGLLRLGSAVMQRYSDAKARHAQLDFDDLIAKAASLLSSRDRIDWVLYKLDGGLDHILVDEAQDTSPVQWKVITALAEEFFSGIGAREESRTLFAVGDEKQSIYSFQGAEPAMFAAQGAELGERAVEAGSVWRRVPLTLSFRTVEPVLDAVDAVFADPARTPGLGAARVSHKADRAGHAGLVEIWPTEKHEKPEAAEVWSPLEEAADATPSVVRVANRIAGTIAGWLRSGEMLASEGRPVRAGDILVLVRKRMPFAPALVSALKTLGVPVAGADRLMLTEQIAVQDLIALGDVLLLPDDDLSLAAVLKSPLFDLDDDDLMALAHGRERSLWDELQAHAGSGDRFALAAETLARWRGEAEEAPPYEFYARVLDRDGGRGRMLQRLGTEAADAIDELLNLALADGETAPPTLQGFLARLRESQREIKRDMEQGRDEVRVMTVHGAKGLEAPIVFLPDTCSTRSARRPGELILLEQAERQIGLPPPFLWPIKGMSKLEIIKNARDRLKRADAEERNRLLYVALTRPRDRLYVAGFEGAQKLPDDCWYNLIKTGLADRLREVTDADGRTVWRLASEQLVPPAAGKARTAAAAGPEPMPAWATTPAPAEPMLTEPVAPSRLAPLEAAAGQERTMQHRPLRKRRERPAEPPMLSPTQLADWINGALTA